MVSAPQVLLRGGGGGVSRSCELTAGIVFFFCLDIFSIKPDDEPPPHPVPAALPSSLDLMAPPTGSPTPPSVPHPEALCVTTDGNGNPQIVTSSMILQGQSNGASAKDLALIPPPSDFMDRPRPQVHLDRARDLGPSSRMSSNKPRGNIDLEQLRQRATARRPSGGFSTTQESPDMPQPEGYPGLSPLDITSSPQMSPHPDDASPQVSPPPEAAGPQMSPPPDTAGPQVSPLPDAAGPQVSPLPDAAGPHMSPPHDAVGPHLSSPHDAVGPHMSPPHDAVGPHLSPLPNAVGPHMSPPHYAVGPQMSPPHDAVGPHLSPCPDVAEPRSPPAVAPRPKKLPPNIILNSHKASDGHSGHHVASRSDRVMDPVHFEALRKLGLLKGDEVEPGPNLSPRMSPKARSSWAAPPSPRSPATPHRQHFTPSNTYVHSLPPVSVPVPLLSPAAVPPSVQLPDFLPVPDAFCDSLGPQASDNEPSAAVGVSEADVHAQEKTPPPSPLKLTPPRIVGVKSATLERSGLGLSSSFNIEGSGEDGDLNPRQLRNNRPRPASLGSGKEFSSTQREAVARQEPEYRRSVQAPRRSLPAPTYQHSRDSSKLPRSQGISVLICPRSENEEDRRQALRRLGLLRDWRSGTDASSSTRLPAESLSYSWRRHRSPLGKQLYCIFMLEPWPEYCHSHFLRPLVTDIVHCFYFSFVWQELFGYSWLSHCVCGVACKLNAERQ